MNRRLAISALAASAGGVASRAIAAPAGVPAPAIPGAVEIVFDEEILLPAKSNSWPGGERPVMTTGKGVFRLGSDLRLTATIHGGVTQYSECELWLSVAVFDGEGRLLGAANHRQPIGYVRLGVMPTIFNDIELDFGIAKSFRQAKYAVICISDRDIPKAPA